MEEKTNKSKPPIVFEQPDIIRQQIEESLEQEANVAAAANSAAIPPDLKAAPKPLKWFRTTLAIVCLLLMSSIAISFYYYSQQAKAKTLVVEMQAQHAALLKRKSALEATLAVWQNADLQQIPMLSSSANTPLATVFWNRKTRDLYLVAQQLPATDPGKQFQLWAQVNGQWINTGLLPWGSDGAAIKMQSLDNANAFAISLEAAGGSASPSENNWVAFSKN